jgi:hypothetical protein
MAYDSLEKVEARSTGPTVLKSVCYSPVVTCFLCKLNESALDNALELLCVDNLLCCIINRFSVLTVRQR